MIPVLNDWQMMRLIEFNYNYIILKLSLDVDQIFGVRLIVQYRDGGGNFHHVGFNSNMTVTTFE